jgi:hypothetical protein
LRLVEQKSPQEPPQSDAGCPRAPADLVAPNELVERRLLIDVLSVSSSFDRDVMKKRLQKNIEIPEKKE